MTRTLSGPAKAALIKRDNDDPFLVLLTVQHDGLLEVLRVVNNNVAITSRGDVFQPFAFAISLPDENKDSIPKAKLEIQNIDRQIIDFLHSVATPPMITIEIILASTPNTVEASWSDLYVDDVQYDAQSVQLKLTYESVLDETFTSRRYDPADFPGLY